MNVFTLFLSLSLYFKLHVPPYSSSLLFELYKSSNNSHNLTDNSHYIQLFYRNSSSDDLTPMNIPNCGIKCSLNQFYKLYDNILASDFTAECQLPNEQCIPKNRASSVPNSIHIYSILIWFVYYLWPKNEHFKILKFNCQ